MRRTGVNVMLGLTIGLVWVVTPMRVGATTAQPAVPAWATAAASVLVGSSAPSVSNPHPQLMTVDELARRIYAGALATHKLPCIGAPYARSGHG